MLANVQSLRFRHSQGRTAAGARFDEWSDTRIVPVLANAVLEVFSEELGAALRLGGELEWAKVRWGLPGPP